MNRETLAWALVFSVPPGVGIAGFAASVIGRGALDPLAVAAGAASALVIFSAFAFVTAAGSAREGSADPRDG